jgi:ectoine hydroxylase-related dioxygenase (phytanoyl-CoA dioxygenase family)
MLTVWFSLTDAPLEAGCLKVLPRSHRTGLLSHCPQKVTGRLQIPDKLLPDPDGFLPLPMKRGDVLLMHRLTCHGSLPNHSDSVRWSMDLRYHPVGQATGRAAFPGFVARSRAHPETELRDAEVWARMWHEARRALAEASDPVRFNRWDPKAAVCA